MFQVIVRLRDGEEVDAGAFEDREAAGKRVSELVATSDAAQWLELGNRNVRVNAVVSIDVHEGRAPRWKGSETRQRWGDED